LVALAVAVGWCFLAFPLKLIARLAARCGHASLPGRAVLAGDNPIRRRQAPDIGPVGIRRREYWSGRDRSSTVAAAQRAGPDSRLIAVDIQPKMIAVGRARARRGAGASNLRRQRLTTLDDGSVDRAFLIAVLPEIHEPGRARPAHRVLRPILLSITEDSDPDYLFLPRRFASSGRGSTSRRNFGNLALYTANFRKGE
jgi:hypothetical protein